MREGDARRGVRGQVGEDAGGTAGCARWVCALGAGGLRGRGAP